MYICAARSFFRLILTSSLVCSRFCDSSTQALVVVVVVSVYFFFLVCCLLYFCSYFFSVPFVDFIQQQSQCAHPKIVGNRGEAVAKQNITCTHTHTHTPNVLKKFFGSKAYNVEVLCSNFVVVFFLYVLLMLFRLPPSVPLI